MDRSGPDDPAKFINVYVPRATPLLVKSITEDRGPINPGDRVLIYTDGVTEAPARNGEEFGVKRLINHLDQNKSRALKTVLDTLVNEITSFAGTILPDDVFIVGIEFMLS